MIPAMDEQLCQLLVEDVDGAAKANGLTTTNMYANAGMQAIVYVWRDGNTLLHELSISVGARGCGQEADVSDSRSDANTSLDFRRRGMRDTWKSWLAELLS